MQFAKKLGDPNQTVRHATIKKLRLYIRSRSAPDAPGFSELDFLKLHKALYFCVWLSDKRPVQESLTDLISPLLHECGGTEEEDEEAGRVYLEMEEEWVEGHGGHAHDEGGIVS